MQPTTILARIEIAALLMGILFAPGIYLLNSSDQWKDKTLLSVKEDQVRRITLRSTEGELVLEKKEDGWRVIQPEDYLADPLALRTLFEQLEKVQADAFADSVDASQVDFEEADYKISVRMADDSLKLVLLNASDVEGQYYAKNTDSDFSYLVSQPLMDNLFGWKFKHEAEDSIE